MQPTPENMQVIQRKLSRFRSWPGFPKAQEDLENRARLLCKLVKNQTLLEIYGEEVARRFEEHGFTINTNDLDWLLDTIQDSVEVFPMHAAIRRIYGRYFVIENERMVQAAAADLAGDVW